MSQDVALPEQSQNKSLLHIAAASGSVPSPETKPRRKSNGGRKGEGVVQKNHSYFKRGSSKGKQVSLLSLSLYLSLSLSFPPVSFSHQFSFSASIH